MEVNIWGILLFLAPVIIKSLISTTHFGAYVIIITLLLVTGMRSGLFIENKIEFNSSSDAYVQLNNNEISNQDSYNLQNILDNSQTKVHSTRIHNTTDFNYSMVLKLAGKDEIEVVKISL